jgi:quercetin dioxygenase-like cupin family protein
MDKIGSAMIVAGQEFEIAALGIRVIFLRTGADTGGELVEYDVVGRSRGFTTQAHLHPKQSERHEVLAGSIRITMNGVDHELGPGESILIPAGTAHRQLFTGEGEGRVRVQLRPAMRTAQLIERLAEFSRDGQLTKSGYPKPGAATQIILDFPEEGYAPWPPFPVQRKLAQAVRAVSGWFKR